MKKLLVILGPTATGKTDLAITFAKKFNGELVSCDSRQVYRGLDIGTGKISNSFKRNCLRQDKYQISKSKDFWDVDGIKIWMYDVISPKRQYTVADYVQDADRIIEDIRERGKLPILAGGTGLYLKALLDGLLNLEIPLDFELRKRLEKLSKEQLQKKLQETLPDKWKRLNVSDRQNPRRLIRAIELSTVSMIGRSPRHVPERYMARNVILKIGLNAPRQDLYQRVDKHVINRMNQGMIEEANRLHQRGLTLKRMRQLGLEYGVLADYLASKIKTRQDLIKIMQGKIHGYVRRQLTWFKKEKGIFWFDIISKDFLNRIEELVNKWYYNEIS